MSIRKAALFLVAVPSLLLAQPGNQWNSIIGSAFTGAQGYRVLQRLTDEAGGRLVGSQANEKGLDLLTQELRGLGLEPRREIYTIPGWVRGDDDVSMLLPTTRRLRAAALGFTDSHPPLKDTVVFAGLGFPETYRQINARGKIVLVTSEAPPHTPPPLRYEAIDIAAAHGAKGILFINDKEGGLILCGVTNFQGKPSPIPAYSITLEEGRWIQRLIERSVPVIVHITTRSHCAAVQTSNLVVTFPGSLDRTIVVGAHFDSWDVGQGATDNGTGSAVLFDVARLLKGFSPVNRYTVEMVWFNGEELGLWGSKRYAELHPVDSIAAMVNMDMEGSPVGFNAMGYDEAIPMLSSMAKSLGGLDLRESPVSIPGTNSDHEPFMLNGIPTFSIDGRLDAEKVRYYHDLGDTFDKVNRKYLSEAAAVATILVKELANSTELKFQRRTRKETVELLKKHNVDERLKRQKEWPFD